MHCPRCGKEMQEILSEGEAIQYCTACHGSWLDKDEARAFTHYPERVLKALNDELIDPTSSPIHCPRCGGSMTEGGLFQSDYRLDRCNGCGGVWFDARELSRLGKITPISRPKPAAKPAPPPPPMAQAGPKASPRPSVRCPFCGRPPTPGDRWQCSCGLLWEPFSRNGTCPRCGRQWQMVKCAECGGWGDLRAWRGDPSRA